MNKENNIGIITGDFNKSKCYLRNLSSIYYCLSKIILDFAFILIL